MGGIKNKNHMKKIILALLVVVGSLATAAAQKGKGFEGTITFSINFEGSSLPPEALAMFKGAETVTYIKGEKSRVDMNLSIQSTTAIVDNKNKTMVTLMDFMGQKYLIRMNMDEIKKENEKAAVPTIKYLDETKEIAGFKCKKAELTMKSETGKDEVMSVYYTEEIPTSEIKPTFKGFKGFPLEYSLNQGGIKMSFTAKSVSKEPVADSKFDIPKEGYTETTMEEFKNSMMKMGGK